MKVDKQLLNRCLKADRRAQLELYKACYSLMKSTCSRYVFQQADLSDVMNQGFLKILNGLEHFDTSRTFEPWARRIMINTALDYCRKLKRKQMTKDLDEMMEFNVDAERWSEVNLAELQFDVEELLDMVRQLKGTTAQVFNLYAIDGYTHEEVSVALRMSTSNSKWHLAKARRLLQEMIEKKTKILTNKINAEAQANAQTKKKKKDRVDVAITGQE